MSEGATEKKIVNRIPLHWAVSITVVLALIPGLFLGKWNFTLWAIFIVWAEYFALGATVDTWKLVIPSIPFGAAAGALWLALTTFLSITFGGGPFVQFIWLSIGNLVFVTLLVWLIPKWDNWAKGTLAVFNGLTVWLAVYFTGSFPAIGLADNPYGAILWSFIWTVLMCYFGWFLGWLNVTIMFPKEVDA